MTALDVAEAKGHRDIVALLRDHLSSKSNSRLLDLAPDEPDPVPEGPVLVPEEPDPVREDHDLVLEEPDPILEEDPGTEKLV